MAWIQNLLINDEQNLRLLYNMKNVHGLIHISRDTVEETKYRIGKER